MLGGEHIRKKVCASCLGVLRKLATCSSWVTRFKEKDTVRVCIQGSKSTNKLERKYLEGNMLEASYDLQVLSLKCNKQCNGEVFRELNSEVRDG